MLDQGQAHAPLGTLLIAYLVHDLADDVDAQPAGADVLEIAALDGLGVDLIGGEGGAVGALMGAAALALLPTTTV